MHFRSFGKIADMYRNIHARKETLSKKQFAIYLHMCYN